MRDMLVHRRSDGVGRGGGAVGRIEGDGSGHGGVDAVVLLALSSFI